MKVKSSYQVSAFDTSVADELWDFLYGTQELEILGNRVTEDPLFNSQLIEKTKIFRSPCPSNNTPPVWLFPSLSLWTSGSESVGAEEKKF